jgi:hypothetical protein
MTGAGCCDGCGADDGAFRPPEAAPEDAPTDPEPEAFPSVEPALPADPSEAELPETGVGETPEAGEVPVMVPFDGEVELEATGAVECPGRAWLK